MLPDLELVVFSLKSSAAVKSRKLVVDAKVLAMKSLEHGAISIFSTITSKLG